MQNIFRVIKLEKKALKSFGILFLIRQFNSCELKHVVKLNENKVIERLRRSVMLKIQIHSSTYLFSTLSFDNIEK